MISATDYKYPLQVLYLFLAKDIFAVKYDTENNFQCMSRSCSTSCIAVVRDSVLILYMYHIYIELLIYYFPCTKKPVFFVVLRPNAGQGLLILEVSRSHSTTHHIR